MAKIVKCKNNKVVWEIVSSNPEIKLEELYFKGQGCTIEDTDDQIYLSVFSAQNCNCEHCKTLEFEFDEIIKEIKLTAISENTRY